MFAMFWLGGGIQTVIICCSVSSHKQARQTHEAVIEEGDAYSRSIVIE
jgi:hypothetical protein